MNVKEKLAPVVLVGALVLVGCKSESAPLVPTVSPDIPARGTVVPENAGNKMKDFHSQKLPFSIKIPSDWNDSEISYASAEQALLRIKDEVFFSITRIDRSTYMAAEEWAQGMETGGNSWVDKDNGIRYTSKSAKSEEGFSIDNHEALGVDSEITDEHGTILHKDTQYVFEDKKTGKLWFIGLTSQSIDQYEEELLRFEEAVRTFRLTEK